QSKNASCNDSLGVVVSRHAPSGETNDQQQLPSESDDRWVVRIMGPSGPAKHLAVRSFVVVVVVLAQLFVLQFVCSSQSVCFAVCVLPSVCPRHTSQSVCFATCLFLVFLLFYLLLFFPT
ncbi:unnamed protein product, partial [Polarella glacialis]